MPHYTGRVVKILSLRNQTTISDKCFVAVRFFDRLIGLIGKTHFDVGEGMLFPKCQSVHTWFMKTAIDVVFLKNDVVHAVYPAVKPWKIWPLVELKASDVLELPAGSIERLSIHAGDQICIS